MIRKSSSRATAAALLALTGACIPLPKPSQTLDDTTTTTNAAANLETAPIAGCTETAWGGAGALKDYLGRMATSGWKAKNLGNGLKMLGCADDEADALNCLKDDAKWPQLAAGAGARDWKSAAANNGGKEFTMRVLRAFTKDDGSSMGTHYWTRSSADGRFIGNGLREAVSIGGKSYEGAIDDLLLADRPRIYVNAKYDPGFMPDNKGFVFQGGAGYKVCNQSLLVESGRRTLDPAAETGRCAGDNVELYQHVGATLDPTNPFYVTLQQPDWSGDNGGVSGFKDPKTTGFNSSTASITAYMMKRSGDSFIRDRKAEGLLSYEGDAVISTATGLLATRISDKTFVGENTYQAGFNVHTVLIDEDVLDMTPVAKICMNGGKPAFSYDDRFLTFHHYVAAGDWKELGYASATVQEFKDLVGKAANVYVVDLKNGQRTRVTTMKPNQYALYPHFRADGWLYILVREFPNGVPSQKATLVAADVAVHMEKAP